jgi:hypothetical protein
MTNVRSSTSWLGLLVLVSAGCSASLKSSATASQTSLTSWSAPTASHPLSTARAVEDPTRGQGFAGLVLWEARDAGLTDAQEALVDSIQRELLAETEPLRSKKKDLDGILADGVARRDVDMRKVEDAVVDIASQSASLPDTTARILARLHTVLDEAQRRAVVYKLEAAWSAWQHARLAQLGSGASQPEEELSRLSGEIGLTPDQFGAIRTKLTSTFGLESRIDAAAAEKRNLDSFGASFMSDSFDPKAIPPEPSPASVAMHMARFFQVIAPTLGPDQAANLARTLRERAESAI